MKRVNKEKAEKLVKSGALLVDMRSPVAYRDGHIEGAVNLPLRNFANKIIGLDKSKKIIIYSDDVNDAELKQGVVYAQTLGFSDIFVSDYRTLSSNGSVNSDNYRQKPTMKKPQKVRPKMGK